MDTFHWKLASLRRPPGRRRKGLQWLSPRLGCGSRYRFGSRFLTKVEDLRRFQGFRSELSSPQVTSDWVMSFWGGSTGARQRRRGWNLGTSHRLFHEKREPPGLVWYSNVLNVQYLDFSDGNHTFSIFSSNFTRYQPMLIGSWRDLAKGVSLRGFQSPWLPMAAQVSQWLLAAEVSRGAELIDSAWVSIFVDAGFFGRRNGRIFCSLWFNAELTVLPFSAIFAVCPWRFAGAGWLVPREGWRYLLWSLPAWHPMRDGLSSLRRGPPSRPSPWRNECEC